MSPLVGSSIRRREDPRLLRGEAAYTDDIKLPNLAYLTIMRSLHAHARIRNVNVSAAAALPGVVRVYLGADLDGRLNPVPCAWNVPGCNLKLPPHPQLATDTVRYVGDGIAAVVAESRAVAQDALDLIEVDYEPLEAVIDPEEAAREGAPQLHPDVERNLAFSWKVGADASRAFDEAEVTVSLRLEHPRLQPTPIEPRAAMAQFNPATRELTLWCTSQAPHIHRLLCAHMLDLPEHNVRVIAPEIGGAFGSKLTVYADEALVAFAAMDLRRPVKWTEGRSENFQTTTHGRDHVQYVDLCGRRDGRITGLRSKVYAGLGAYASTAAPGVPTILHGLIYGGPYTIGAIEGVVHGVYTTATPVGAYRGAGRPETTYLLERLVDAFAREIDFDVVEVRRRNLIGKDQFPYDTSTGLTYDSGDYAGALDKALSMIDYQSFRREQEAAREDGRYLGVGVTTYTEICGLGPSKIAGAVGFGGGLYDSAVVRVFPTGMVRVYIGCKPHGQGEETTFAQLVAEEFGIDISQVQIVAGDTETTPQGWGTYGSRTTAVCGSAVIIAARRLKDKARAIAAHLLEAAPGEVEWRDGGFSIRGAPEARKEFGELAHMANVAWNLPEGMEPGLEATAFFDPPNFVYPFGTHACTVEVDPETGETEILRYVAVDDCGPQINPMIVAGQIHGGVVQGIGEALHERAVYDEDGQLLTGTLMDYAVPRASWIPPIETAHTETPTDVNPLGVKGVGEAGTIASVPTVVNAVLDALSPLGVTHLDKPLTPARVWAAIREVRS